MNHKRIVAWLKEHRSVLIKSTIISAALLLFITVVVGNSISSEVVKRNSLFGTEIQDLSLEIYEAPLSGILVDGLDFERPVTAVIVENSPEARPQSGLGSAEVVFEAIAEGGITRFVSFFQAEKPTRIGPVRSARPAFNDWALSFDASLAHAGGSAQGLSEIRSFGIVDLDQFANSSFYYRDSSRYAPHNLYTSMENLDDLNAAKGHTTSDFTPWEFDDGEPAETITAKSVSAVISSYLFNIDYDYSKTQNKYLRSVGGVAHRDANTDKQIALDNVIIMEASYSIGGIYYNYDLTGSGVAHIFKNGEYTKGRWQRPSRRDSFAFTAADKDVIFNRGHTWVTAIQPGNTLTITPEVQSDG